MEVLVKGLHGAMEFVPTKSTYAIRIFGSLANEGKYNKEFLKNDDKYLYIARYTFDDIDPGFLADGILFNGDMAKKIINEFSENGLNKADVLLVNCTRGENRSPAIALALNEIFKLNGGIIWEKYPGMNRYLYDVMKDVATRDLKVR